MPSEALFREAAVRSLAPERARLLARRFPTAAIEQTHAVRLRQAVVGTIWGRRSERFRRGCLARWQEEVAAEGRIRLEAKRDLVAGIRYLDFLGEDGVLGGLMRIGALYGRRNEIAPFLGSIERSVLLDTRRARRTKASAAPPLGRIAFLIGSADGATVGEVGRAAQWLDLLLQDIAITVFHAEEAPDVAAAHPWAAWQRMCLDNRGWSELLSVSARPQVFTRATLDLQSGDLHRRLRWLLKARKFAAVVFLPKGQSLRLPSDLAPIADAALETYDHRPD